MPRRRYYFCLSSGFTMYSFSCTIDVLRAASLVQADEILETRIVAQDTSSIRCGNGTRILPDVTPQDMKAPGVLVVIAGTGATTQNHSDEVAIIRAAKARGFEIWGISSGVIPLAIAGVLDDRTAAAHWQDRAFLAENFPKIRLTGKIFDRGPRISTCVGGAAASDMVLSHLSEFVSAEVGSRVLALLNIETQRSGQIDQAGSTVFQFPSRNDHVNKAIQFMHQHVHRRPAILDVAAAIGISQKQLERLFKADFGRTPRQVLEQMCMEQARREVLLGRRQIVSIARDFGYDSSIFSAKYRQAFGFSPLQDRRTQGHEG